MGDNLAGVVIFFAFYAFIGWILETISASISANRFINRGFLTGPFCPIYGFGAILIIQTYVLLGSISQTESILLIASIGLSMLLTTILEYITGYALEKIFYCKWWDYSKEFLNLHGRVCLKYSLLWGLLTYFLLLVVHPFSIKYFATVPIFAKYILMITLIIFFLFDTMYSVTEVLDLKRLLSVSYKIPITKSYETILTYKRIFLAFPELYFFNIGKFNNEIRSFLHGKVERIKIQIKSRLS
ncbi:putative ABC transporter permease [Desulfitibacter alkalitolerans]|uniref:putative ABC transporter permease n=1 Tax=Desulfitibacter alkalitolerans TaxID=264641 RepID=UPI00048A3198|nr:putative ABC transporter permease [Desulfitibacter alkalitolerans]